MKKVLILLFAVSFLLASCASLTYESADGTKVTYHRFCTGSDSIKGVAGDAQIEAIGQKQLDPAVLQLLIEAARMRQ